MPSPEKYPEEIWGIEDPRITFVPELQQYAVTYTSYSRGGPGVSLALTKDFRSFERYGVIIQMFGLLADWLQPIEAKPVQSIINHLNRLVSLPALVRILNS